MKNSQKRNIAGWNLFALGCMHQIVHLAFSLNPEKPPIHQHMVDFKIEMMGTHSLAQFHNGFSLMTGFFLMSLGLIIALISKEQLPKKTHYIFVITLITIGLVSVVYFHALAYGMTAISLMFYALSLRKKT